MLFVESSCCKRRANPTASVFSAFDVTMELQRPTLKTPRVGLDRHLYPMRLFEKAKKLGVWDPQEIDFSQALADAAVVYQMIVEGVLAETGYHAYYTVLEEASLLPGMRQFIGKVQRDESRHIGYGVFLLSRLVAEHGAALWEGIETRMNQLIMVALQNVEETLAPYGDDVPFGVSADDFTGFAMSQFQKRYARIECANSQTLDEVLYAGAAQGDGEANADTTADVKKPVPPPRRA
jgi:hypothetical protein